METVQEELSDEDTFHYPDLESVNKGLSIIGEYQSKKSKLQTTHYPKEKLTKIKSAFMKSLYMSEDTDDKNEIIQQLRKGKIP